VKFFPIQSIPEFIFWNLPVLEYLPPSQECDFSKDLFPLLLEKDEPMYGYVAEGYWCDVGHLDAYRESQYDGCTER
jgi:mannose-1-phosphate guanylyltransferase/phosphomannomutase